MKGIHLGKNSFGQLFVIVFIMSSILTACINRDGEKITNDGSKPYLTEKREEKDAQIFCKNSIEHHLIKSYPYKEMEEVKFDKKFLSSYKPKGSDYWVIESHLIADDTEGKKVRFKWHCISAYTEYGWELRGIGLEETEE